MVEQRSTGRYRSRRVGAAVIALGLGSAVLVGCSSNGQPSAGTTPAASSSPLPSGSATAGTPSTASSTASGTASGKPTAAGSGAPSGGASTAGASSTAPSNTSTTGKPSAGSTAATVPSRVQKTNAPTKKLTKVTSTVAPKVTAELTSIRSAQVNSKNPGEISGNAVIFGLKVVNNSGRTFDLGNVVVTVLGANGDPASQITSSPAAPFSGSAKNGTTATSTYVFVVPKGQRNPITVNVTLTADTTVAVFKGNAG